jgi:hypothetical protein
MDVHPTKNVSIGIDPYPYGTCPTFGKMCMDDRSALYKSMCTYYM